MKLSTKRNWRKRSPQAQGAWVSHTLWALPAAPGTALAGAPGRRQIANVQAPGCPGPPPPELPQALASSSRLGGEAAPGPRSWPRFHLSLQGCIHSRPVSFPGPSGLAWLGSLSSLQGPPWPGNHRFSESVFGC